MPGGNPAGEPSAGEELTAGPMELQAHIIVQSGNAEQLIWRGARHEVAYNPCMPSGGFSSPEGINSEV